jgi:hypothetical protein
MSTQVPPFLVLQARAEARAILFAAGEYESIDAAIAPLMQYALTNDLAEQLGADVVFAIIIKPFEPITR